MPAGPAFEATIRALDQITPVLKAVRESVQSVGLAARESEGELHGMERQVTRFGAAGVHFRRMSGHVQTLRGHFDLLAGAIGGAHSRLSSLLPALSGLASVTSVAGVFHLVDKVSERRNESIKTARNLGISTSQLGAINYAAAVADVPAETMQNAVAKLERNMSMAARGKNKDLAALFNHVHLQLKDAHGDVRSVTDVLPDIADVIQKTKPERRQDVTQAFFGKGGKDLVGFMAQGGAALRTNLHDVEGAGMTTKTDDDFRAYNKSMVQLNSAVKGVTNTIAAILAPVLKPIVDMFAKWLIVKRAWIGQNLKQALLDIGEALKHVDWKAWGDALRDALHVVRWLIDHLGGLQTILEALIAIRVLGWVSGFVGQFAGIAAAVGRATQALMDFRRASKAGAAAEAASGAESAAAAGAGGAAAGAEGKALAAGERAAEGAGLGMAARRVLATSLRFGLPIAAFMATLDGGGLNEGERDLNSDPEVRRAYLRSMPVPVYAGEPEGPAPDVRVTPEALPQFPRIVVPIAEQVLALQRQRATLNATLHPAATGGTAAADEPGLSGSLLALRRQRDALDAMLHPGGSLFGLSPAIGGQHAGMPQLYPGGIGGLVQSAAPPVRGQVDVNIRLPNMPSGASVQSVARGDARVLVDTGRNYPDGDVNLGDLGLHF